MARLTKTLKKKFQGIDRVGLYAYFLDPYKPELHYMRGPGPRWHEKHSSSQQKNDGRDCSLAVAPSSDQTRVPPDTLSAPRR